MAAGDAVVHNSVFAIGLGGYTYSNVKVRKATVGDCSKLNDISGEQGETLSKIQTNPGETLKLEGAVLTGAALTAVKALSKGSHITINSVKYMVVEPSVVYTPADVTMCDLDLIAEDSMTATYT
jgi:hypothetical protein